MQTLSISSVEFFSPGVAVVVVAVVTDCAYICWNSTHFSTNLAPLSKILSGVLDTAVPNNTPSVSAF